MQNKDIRFLWLGAAFLLSKLGFYKKLETKSKRQEGEAPAAPILVLHWFVVGFAAHVVYINGKKGR